MRIKLAIIALLAIALCFIASCAKQHKEIEIYSFNGENDTITINNGLIIVTDDLEKFIGGELTFKGEELSDVKYYVAKFFFYKDGIETTISNNSQSIEGTTKGTHISPDMGSISSKDLFYGNDLELIKKSLNFSLSGIFMNEENFEYNVVLNIKKVY